MWVFLLLKDFSSKKIQIVQSFLSKKSSLPSSLLLKRVWNYPALRGPLVHFGKLWQSSLELIIAFTLILSISKCFGSLVILKDWLIWSRLSHHMVDERMVLREVCTKAFFEDRDRSSWTCGFINRLGSLFCESVRVKTSFFLSFKYDHIGFLQYLVKRYSSINSCDTSFMEATHLYNQKPFFFHRNMFQAYPWYWYLLLNYPKFNFLKYQYRDNSECKSVWFNTGRFFASLQEICSLFFLTAFRSSYWSSDDKKRWSNFCSLRQWYVGWFVYAQSFYDSLIQSISLGDYFYNSSPGVKSIPFLTKFYCIELFQWGGDTFRDIFRLGQAILEILRWSVGCMDSCLSSCSYTLCALLSGGSLSFTVLFGGLSFFVIWKLLYAGAGSRVFYIPGGTFFVFLWAFWYGCCYFLDIFSSFQTMNTCVVAILIVLFAWSLASFFFEWISHKTFISENYEYNSRAEWAFLDSLFFRVSSTGKECAQKRAATLWQHNARANEQAMYMTTLFLPVVSLSELCVHRLKHLFFFFKNWVALYPVMFWFGQAASDSFIIGFRKSLFYSFQKKRVILCINRYQSILGLTDSKKSDSVVKVTTSNPIEAWKHGHYMAMASSKYLFRKNTSWALALQRGCRTTTGSVEVWNKAHFNSFLRKGEFTENIQNSLFKVFYTLDSSRISLKKPIRTWYVWVSTPFGWRGYSKDNLLDIWVRYLSSYSKHSEYPFEGRVRPLSYKYLSFSDLLVNKVQRSMLLDFHLYTRKQQGSVQNDSSAFLDPRYWSKKDLPHLSMLPLWCASLDRSVTSISYMFEKKKMQPFSIYFVILYLSTSIFWIQNRIVAWICKVFS